MTSYLGNTLAGNLALPRGRMLLGDRELPHCVWRADTWRTRTRGLLGMSELSNEEALLIEPCNGIHTFGMAYPIDVVFLSRRGAILKLKHHLACWRLAFCLRAYATLELAAGSIKALDLSRGQKLQFEWDAGLKK